MKKSKKTLGLIILACVTLGLAPFFPEPHLWGKLKWAYGGGEGMLLKDWFDLILHSSPWIILLIYLLSRKKQ